MRDKVVVAFAVNKEFVPYCFVAIFSLIDHIESVREYEIIILETELSEEDIELLGSLSNDKVIVRCINISEYIRNIVFEESIHLSVETYYRLFIPAVLSQYERVLYLDSDLCVLRDVAELFDEDIEGYPVGAIQDVHSKNIRNHSIDIGNLDYHYVFNAGVLLINTKEFEKQNIRNRCLEELRKDYAKKNRKLVFADQDALNIVLYRNFRELEKKWNCQWFYTWRPEALDDDYRERYFNDLNNAYIIHYSGDIKPWKHPDKEKAELFWKYAAKTSVFQRILVDNMIALRDRGDSNKCFEKYRFPYDQIPYGSKVVLYGAGEVGRSFYEQNLLTKYVRYVLWVDRDFKIKSEDMPVRSIEDIRETEYDYILIAINRESVALNAIHVLKKMDVQSESIVWQRYH